MSDETPLFPPESYDAGRELLHLDDLEKRGVFSGERLKKNREKYQEIIRALGEGVGIRRISRAFGVSPHTVMAIREREAGDIATEKERAVQKLGSLYRLTLERLEEELAAGGQDARDLSVCAREIGNHWMLLAGEPTARIERREVRTGDQVAAALLAEIVVSPDSESGENEGKPKQIAGPTPESGNQVVMDGGEPSPGSAAADGVDGAGAGACARAGGGGGGARSGAGGGC